MRQPTVLLAALTAIQSSGVSAKVLADRSGLSVPTCRKILADTNGTRRYHWSSIEFALRHTGNRLLVVADRGDDRTETLGYERRRYGTRSLR